jgi:8-oxo-dGTP pyrophosphatase MutT (NUDIX family)
MRIINRTIVSALLFSADGKLFQGKKHPKKGGVYNDCWHIPGGGIDDGEELIAALIREIKEETGLDISALPIELIDDIGTGSSIKTLDDGEQVQCEMKFNVYQVNLNLPAADLLISLDDDLEIHRWADINNLDPAELTPPSVELFERLGYL